MGVELGLGLAKRPFPPRSEQGRRQVGGDLATPKKGLGEWLGAGKHPLFQSFPLPLPCTRLTAAPGNQVRIAAATSLLPTQKKPLHCLPGLKRYKGLGAWKWGQRAREATEAAVVWSWDLHLHFTEHPALSTPTPASRKSANPEA